MRVLFYRQFIGQDGIATWMMTLASHLRRVGVDCAFWFPKVFYKPIADFERLGHVYTSAPHELVSVLKSEPFDIIHVVNSDFTAELFGLLQPAPRIVVTSHGDLADAWHSGNCFAYTAVSEDMAELNGPLTDLVIEPIPNGVDCERFTPSRRDVESRPVVAWVGRSTDPRKDFARFTRIAEKLRVQGVRLWVADAHGATWNDLKELSCRHVEFDRWERVPVSEMPRFYQEVCAAGGLLLMTSLHEGWGLAAVEAAACGVPTLAPDVVGLRRAILPGITGEIYSKEATESEVAELAMGLINRIRTTWSQEGCVSHAKRSFSAEVMARSYLRVYAGEQQQLRDNSQKTRHTPLGGPAEMVKRLQLLRWHRASSMSDAARQFANSRQPALAWRALSRSVAIAPRSALHPARAGELLKTSAINLKGLMWRAPSNQVTVKLNFNSPSTELAPTDTYKSDESLSTLNR